MRMLLELAGQQVQVVHSGQEALRMVKNLEAQVAILDIGMPDMSGYELAERIRAAGAWGKAVRLIAVTGWGQNEDKRRAKVAGFDYHLTKPVAPERLASLIDE
jgi:CheY-like chemotaxis protein